MRIPQELYPFAGQYLDIEGLRMHYLEASSSREVAALLGVTPKAVEGRLYQARKALRTLAMGEDLREEAKA